MAYKPTIFCLPPGIFEHLTQSEILAAIDAGDVLGNFSRDQWDSEVVRAIEVSLPPRLQRNLAGMVDKLRPFIPSVAPFAVDVARCARDLVPLNEKDRISAFHSLEKYVYRMLKRRFPERENRSAKLSALGFMAFVMAKDKQLKDTR